MADCVALNDGTSLVVLNDGTSCVLLNTDVGEAGVQITGTHATQLIGPRAARQDPVEFTFWLKSELIVKVMYRFQLLSTLLRVIQSNIKLKSILLIEISNSLKLKSMLIKPVWERIKFQSSLLTKTKSSFILGSKTENKKLKKALLRKLREYLEEDG